VALKLRLSANTIRVRLNRSEVDCFAAEGRIAEEITFAGGSRLSYALVSSPDTGSVIANFDGGSLVVEIPETAGMGWACSDEVAIEVKPVEGPKILIEKDFQCLHGKDAPDPEAFPNPAS
jgi:hypothetical protein